MLRSLESGLFSNQTQLNAKAILSRFFSNLRKSRRGFEPGNLGVRCSSVWQPWRWNKPFGGPSDIFRQVERDFDRFWNAFPHSGFWPRPSAFFGRIPQLKGLQSNEIPIVELEDGSKKMRLIFDGSGYKPEDIQVKTKGNTLSIDAKCESKSGDGVSNSEFFSTTFSVPEGVKVGELACKYTEEGYIVLEVPYEAPPEEAPKHHEIHVKHE